MCNKFKCILGFFCFSFSFIYICLLWLNPDSESANIVYLVIPCFGSSSLDHIVSTWSFDNLTPCPSRQDIARGKIWSYSCLYYRGNKSNSKHTKMFNTYPRPFNEISNHHNNVHPLFPHHPPVIVERWRHGPLRTNICTRFLVTVNIIRIDIVWTPVKVKR